MIVTKDCSHADLKKMHIDVVARRTHGRVEVSIEALEAMRTNRNPISASKSGLEVICGASCETGAQ